MLSTLRIKNLALVSDLTLELESGLNVITGETGAGKSVIIGAIQLLLGERADRGSIRAGEDCCTVEASFRVESLRSTLRSFLEERGLEPCEDSHLVIKRSFTTAGTNRQFVNGSPTTLAVLGELGSLLVDIHGPHDHQSLLQSSRQLALLDAFGHLESARGQYQEVLSKLQSLQKQKSDLILDERTYAQQLDLLRFQSQEISQARLQPDEEEPLQAEYHRASNAVRLMELTRQALDSLSEGDASMTSIGGQIGRLFQELHRLDPSTQDLHDSHVQAMELLQDLSQSVQRYSDRLEVDPSRFAELESRLELIQSLKRKYGSNLKEVITFGAEAQEKLERLEGREAALSELKASIEACDEQLWKVGHTLSEQRSKVAPKLAREISKELSALGFRQSQFSIAVRSLRSRGEMSSPRSSGLDEVEFQFAPNPGEPQRALKDIASSGEMARVMLAIKTVLAAEDQVPVLVFDEVDANVGGETASVVGLKMAQIAKKRQVLCITHLAPVAASAQAHYLVSKEVRSGRTLSAIDRLDSEARVTEIARMLGGQSTAARKHAQTLLSDTAAPSKR